MSQNTEMFKNKEYDTNLKADSSGVDLENLYSLANAELALQQSKRDQIITIYLAMFYFLLPFALSMDGLGLQVKGFIFLAASVIGWLFALIILRYRIYKEVYWFCCQSITVMMGLKPEGLKKETVQAVFYQVMLKKGKKYVRGTEKKTWNYARFIKDNAFSAETLYYVIHVVLTAAMLGLSVGLISNLVWQKALILGASLAICLFLFLMWMYFKKLAKVFGVLVDGTDVSFNDTYKMAWFLHLF